MEWSAVSSGLHSQLPLLDQKVAQTEVVELSTEEAAQSVRRRLDDGLLVVEGGVEDHWYTGDLREPLDESAEAGAGVPIDRLHPSGSVGMDHAGHAVSAV